MTANFKKIMWTNRKSSVKIQNAVPVLGNVTTVQ